MLGKKLGIGSYAVVKEGMHKISKDMFAVKIIDKKHAKETRLKSEVQETFPQTQATLNSPPVLLI